MSAHSRFGPQAFLPHARRGRESQHPFEFYSGNLYPLVGHARSYGGGWNYPRPVPQPFYHPPPRPHYSPGPIYPQVYPSYMHPPLPAPPGLPYPSPPYAPSVGHQPPYIQHERPYSLPVSPHPQFQHIYPIPPPPTPARFQNADIDGSRLGYALPVSGRQADTTPRSVHPFRGNPATSVPQTSSVRLEATRTAAGNIAQRHVDNVTDSASASPSEGSASLLFSESTTPSPRSSSTSPARDRIDQVIRRQGEDDFQRNATPIALEPTLPQPKPAGPVRLSYAQVADGKKLTAHPTTVAQPGQAPKYNAPPSLSSLPSRIQVPSPDPHPFARTSAGDLAVVKGERSVGGRPPTSHATPTKKKPRRVERPSRGSQTTPTPGSGGSPLGLAPVGDFAHSDTSGNSSPSGYVPPVPHNTPNDLPATSPTGLRALLVPPAPNRAPSPSPSRWITPISGLTPTKSRVNKVKVPYLIYTSPTPKKNASWERPVGDADLLKVPQLNLSTGRLPATYQSLSAAVGSDADVFDGGSDPGDGEGSPIRGRTESLAPDSPLTEQTDELHLFSAPPSPSPATTSLSLPEDDDGGEVCIWFHERKEGGDASEGRGISLLECAHCKAFPQEQEGNPLKERLKLREIDMMFQWDDLPLTRRAIPVSLLGVKIERPELALVIARVCMIYFRKYIKHPSAPDVTRLRLLGARTEGRSFLVPILVEE